MPMRKGLLLAALLLPSLWPASAVQIEGAPGIERASPTPTPVVAAVPNAPALVPLDLPISQLPVAPVVDPSLAPTVPLSNPVKTAAQAASPSKTIPTAAGAAAQASSLSAAKADAPKTAAPVSAKGALDAAAPVVRDILSPSSQRPAEIDSQAASAIFGDAKRPEGAASPVAGSQSAPVSRLQAATASAPVSAQPPKPQKPKWTFTKKMIWANIVAFILTIPAMPVSALLLGFVPGHARAVIALGMPIGIAHAAFTMFSYMFVHGSLSHIFGNMMVFWMFGRAVEARVGKPLTRKIYYLSGLAAAAAAIFLPGSAPIIGASAAVSGIVAAWLVLEKNGRFDTPDARETRLLGWLSAFSLVENLLAGLSALGDLAIFSLGWHTLCAAISFAIVRATLGPVKNPERAKAVFGIWLFAQNLLMFAWSGPFFHGVYVLGHILGGLVGGWLVYKNFLKNSTSRVA